MKNFSNKVSGFGRNILKTGLITVLSIGLILGSGVVSFAGDSDNMGTKISAAFDKMKKPVNPVVEQKIRIEKYGEDYRFWDDNSKSVNPNELRLTWTDFDWVDVGWVKKARVIKDRIVEPADEPMDDPENKPVEHERYIIDVQYHDSNTHIVRYYDENEVLNVVYQPHHFITDIKYADLTYGYYDLITREFVESTDYAFQGEYAHQQFSIIKCEDCGYVSEIISNVGDGHNYIDLIGDINGDGIHTHSHEKVCKDCQHSVFIENLAYVDNDNDGYCDYCKQKQ